MRRDHQLFKQYPLSTTATISTGTVPTPYHIYDGAGIFIGGTVDLASTERLLRDEAFRPVQAADGRTFMGIWICNFTDASLGPHHELQFSFFTSDSESPVAARPLSLLSLMTGPHVRMLCHGLWNNTPDVVAYNRELLSLNARLAHSQIEDDSGMFRFNFQDGSSGRPLLAGRLPNLRRPSVRASWDLVGELGIKRIWALARQPWTSLRILNPSGVLLDRSAVAESFTKNDSDIIRYFNESSDELELGETPYSALGFRPQFVQYMKGFKFVYLEPK